MPDDPMYLDYSNILSFNIQCTTGCKFLAFLKNDVRPSWAADLSGIKARQCPMHLWRRIRDGEVGESTLHKTTFCSSPNRHIVYQKVGYLGGTQLVTHLQFCNNEGQKKMPVPANGADRRRCKSAMDVASRRLFNRQR